MPANHSITSVLSPKCDRLQDGQIKSISSLTGISYKQFLRYSHCFFVYIILVTVFPLWCLIILHVQLSNITPLWCPTTTHIVSSSISFLSLCFPSGASLLSMSSCPISPHSGAPLILTLSLRLYHSRHCVSPLVPHYFPCQVVQYHPLWCPTNTHMVSSSISFSSLCFPSGASLFSMSSCPMSNSSRLPWLISFKEK